MVNARLIQRFIYHDGERVEFLTAPPGSGKTAAVRAWLDTAGDAARFQWFDGAGIGKLSDVVGQLPEDVLVSRDGPPMFVVLDDFHLVPADPCHAELVAAVLDRSPDVQWVICSQEPVPAEFEQLIDSHLLRVTTETDLIEHA